jgi:CarD family transcriptional regulator
MSFMIGQSVIHPAHGAGKIVEFQEKELVKGFQRYYVIKFLRNRLTVHLPEPRIDEIGVRPVMPAGLISGVFETLELYPVDLPDEFRLRRSLIDKKIHSGYPHQIAAAVRDLNWRDTSHYLTEADREALEEARALLITETALALELASDQVEQRVDDALGRGIRTRLAAEELARQAAEERARQAAEELARQAAEEQAQQEFEPVPDWPLPAAVPVDWAQDPAVEPADWARDPAAEPADWARDPAAEPADWSRDPAVERI